MKVIHNLPFTVPQEAVGKTIGFVPTMGYLHEGHISLIHQARQQCDIVVLSIFVNPLQFGPNEDFERYPRDAERDLQLAEQAGVDIVFLPDVKVMYPKPMQTTVAVSGVSERLCGASRPGHFTGVATVVMKLLHIVKPDKVYFGMKDAQQVAVIRTMVEDLNVDVEVVACPTLREADGLAMSSRNVYLSEEERKQASILYAALSEAKALIEEDQGGSVAAGALLEGMKSKINSMPAAQIDYVEIVHYPSLQQLKPDEVVSSLLEEQDILLAVAVKFGRTRLIDNILLSGGNSDVSHNDEIKNS